MTSIAIPPARVAATRGPALAWGLTTFLWLLPLHALAITVLFGGLGWPAAAVRAIAAWKELLIALLLALAVLRTIRNPLVTGRVLWLDLVVAALGCVALGYLIGADIWFGADIPLTAELYGLRDTAFIGLLYFVGRASPEVAESPRTIRIIVAVGLATSAVAVLERIFVTPEMLVVLGTSRYVQDFLGATAITASNVYGLPDNYWTEIGGQLVQRAGSTHLSAQGFAISFLLIVPAATLWVLDASTAGRAVVRWLAYGLIWTGLLLTVTRLTIVVGALQAIAVLLARARWRPLVTLGFAAVASFGAALLLVPGLADFVLRTLAWETSSSVIHLSDWGRGVENFILRPLGTGLGSTDFVAMRFGFGALTADNQYLRYAVELGVLGLLVHVGVLAGALWSGLRARHSPAGILLIVATLGIAVNAMTAVVFNALFLAYAFYWLTGAVTTVSQRWR